MKVKDLAAVPMALVRPDRAFRDPAIYRVPKLSIVIVLFLFSLVGQRLSWGYNENPYAKQLMLAELDARMSSLMASAPSEVRAQVRSELVGSVLGGQANLAIAIGILFNSAVFLLLPLEVWLISIIVTQFFGGQEERHGHKRPALTLCLVAFMPPAVGRLLAGIVLSLKSPDAVANALTMKEYNELSAVHFDFFSLLGIHGIPGILASLLRLLTDPLFLWALCVIILGGREVFRLRLKSAVAQSAVLVLLLALQSTLLAAIGVNMEL
jgi:hypothetical protein